MTCRDSQQITLSRCSSLGGACLTRTQTSTEHLLVRHGHRHGHRAQIGIMLCRSKVLAEQKAFEMCKQQSRWSLVTIQPSVVQGPPPGL